MRNKMTLFYIFCISLLGLCLLLSLRTGPWTSSASRAVSQLQDPALFSDTETDQGSFWNYIVHTHRSFFMTKPYFLPLLLLLSWIPLLAATVITGYLWIHEDVVTKGYAGEVSGEIGELFEPKSAVDLLPRQSFPKVVTLRSTSDIDTRAYIRISIPVIEDRGAAEGPAYVDALTPEINRDDFQLVSSHRGRKAGTASVYLYRFRRALGPGEETPPLFSTVQVPDFQCIPDFSDAIRISGYLIQWEHFAAKDADRLARAWSLQAADEGCISMYEPEPAGAPDAAGAGPENMDEMKGDAINESY